MPANVWLIVLDAPRMPARNKLAGLQATGGASPSTLPYESRGAPGFCSAYLIELLARDITMSNCTQAASLAA